MKDLIARLTSWKTSIIGGATLVLSMLVLFGVIEPEKQADGVASVTSLWDSIVQVLAAISGLVLLFSHDAPPKE
jgi:hypothetical protein